MTEKKHTGKGRALSDLVIVYIILTIIISISMSMHYELHEKLAKLVHINELWHLDEILLIWFSSAAFCFTWYSLRRLRESRLTEARLIEKEAKYSSVVESTDDSIYLVDKEGQYLYMNRKHMSRLGILGASIKGKKYSEFHSPENTKWFINKINSIFTKGKSEYHEYQSGNQYYLQTFSPVRNANKETIAVTIISKNITALKREEGKLRHLTFTDELTGLCNRRGFFTFASEQLMLAERQRLDIVLIYVDIDNLKAINDNLGHDSGDLAISDTANVLIITFRKSDIIARLGGDEFVVMVTETADTDIKGLVYRLKENLETYNNQSNRIYELSLSLGIVSCDAGESLHLEELLSKADRLMYEDKLKKKRKSEIKALPTNVGNIQEIFNKENRSSERVAKKLEAELIINGNIYAARIENLSKNGFKVKAVSTSISSDLLMNKEIDLEFQMPSGERVMLNCIVVWSRKNTPDSLIVDLGLWILERSPLYEEFYNILCMEKAVSAT